MMNMQNKLYTIQFFSPPNNQLCSSLRFCGTCRFRRACGCRRTHKKGQTHKKGPTHGPVPDPQPTSICILSMMSTIWNISTGQLGLAAWLCSLPAPAHLLFSQTWETEKSPWFPRKNWKHQCYQHSSHTKSKTQQLLGGKLTLSQLKPGHEEMV